jgi:hypothetical protein|uniref:Uncharacterized protein n=1 Tax=Bacteriophage sp. TaxID=38018 RepID=A0A7G9A3S3_9VIRU|nr:MAG: hypothetical protein [Bacteriophage sp.]
MDFKEIADWIIANFWRELQIEQKLDAEITDKLPDEVEKTESRLKPSAINQRIK